MGVCHRELLVATLGASRRVPMGVCHRDLLVATHTVRRGARSMGVCHRELLVVAHGPSPRVPMGVCHRELLVAAHGPSPRVPMGVCHRELLVAAHGPSRRVVPWGLSPRAAGAHDHSGEHGRSRRQRGDQHDPVTEPQRATSISPSEACTCDQHFAVTDPYGGQAGHAATTGPGRPTVRGDRTGWRRVRDSAGHLWDRGRRRADPGRCQHFRKTDW
jgi:hypothetical protein